jgi:hypothetical protein
MTLKGDDLIEDVKKGTGGEKRRAHATAGIEGRGPQSPGGSDFNEAERSLFPSRPGD